MAGRSAGLPVLGVFDRGEGEDFEFGDECSEAAGVVEPGLVAVALFGAEEFGDGLVADFAGPLDVRPVEDRWVCLASASGFAAGHVALDDAAGEDEADLAELTGEALLGLALSGAGLGCRGHWFHRRSGIHHPAGFQ